MTEDALTSSLDGATTLGAADSLGAGSAGGGETAETGADGLLDKSDDNASGSPPLLPVS